MPSVRVYGIPGRAVPLRDGRGAPIMGRFVGLDAKGDPVPEGVDHPDDPALWAAVHRGDLTLTPPAAPEKSAPAPSAEPPAPTPARPSRRNEAT